MRFGDAFLGSKASRNTSCLKGPLAVPFYPVAKGKRRESPSMRSERRLQDLISIGPAMLRDFHLLGVQSVSQPRNPRLPVEKCQWWYWSGKRKAQLAR